MKDVRYVEKKSSLWKNKKFLTVLMGLFIISIMVFSVLYYGLDTSGQEKVEFNGFTFIQTNQGWQTFTDDEKRILLLSDPRELENVSLSSVSLDFLSSLGKIYLSFNPEQDVSGALYDFQNNIEFSGSLVAACYEESELCADVPIKSCVDVGLGTGVVIFQEANESSVVVEGNCVTLQGKSLLEVTDRLILDQYLS